MELRLDGLDESARHRKHHAERLVPLKGNRRALPREFPVHREGKGRPVGLDDAGQRLDRILWAVERAGGQEIVAGFGVKQPVHREGQHARSEMAAGEQRALGRRADADAVEAGIAVPFGDERDRV